MRRASCGPTELSHELAHKLSHTAKSSLPANPHITQNDVQPTNQPRHTVKKIIIEGVTESGRKFRPSDWAERMSGSLSTFGRDHRIHYSPLLLPTTINGIKCIIIDPQLKEVAPDMFAYIMGWAANNELKITETDEIPEED